MAQLDLHGLVGLAGAQALVQRRGRSTLAFGFLVGNLLPDMDMIALAGAWFLDREVAHHLHRSFSHSLGAVLFGLVWGSIGAWWLGQRELRPLGAGMALGIAAHIGLDFLVWFSGVQVLWPLPWRFTLWAGFTVSPYLANLLGAAEFLFSALFMGELERLSTRRRTDLSFRPALRRLRTALLVTFWFFVPLALILQPWLFNAILYGVLLLVYGPTYVYVPLRLRRTIGGVER